MRQIYCGTDRFGGVCSYDSMRLFIQIFFFGLFFFFSSKCFQTNGFNLANLTFFKQKLAKTLFFIVVRSFSFNLHFN